MEWVEVSAHRILVVPLAELLSRFRMVDEDGNPSKLGVEPYRVIRDDGRVFKPARFMPASCARAMFTALEEI